MEYNFEADLHTHTIASGHAYNTIREMARAAADKGLKALGIRGSRSMLLSCREPATGSILII